jgi:hypothetical protein
MTNEPVNKSNDKFKNFMQQMIIKMQHNKTYGIQ